MLSASIEFAATMTTPKASSELMTPTLSAINPIRILGRLNPR
jgi:hypothetical protein